MNEETEIVEMVMNDEIIEKNMVKTFDITMYEEIAESKTTNETIEMLSENFKIVELLKRGWCDTREGRR